MTKLQEIKADKALCSSLMEEMKKPENKHQYECTGISREGKLINYNLVEMIKEADDESKRGK